MIATVEWEAVTLAGAFILGAALSAVVVLRITKAVIGVVNREMHPTPPKEDDKESPLGS